MKMAILAGLASIAMSFDAAAAGGRIGATWQPVYGLPPAKAVSFVPEVRALGGGFTRVTLYWTQLEPAPGVERWDELDAYLAQLERPDDAMITIASASPWATRTKAAIFPSSPAKDPDAYYAFIRRVVTRSAGRVRYFQADTEPGNAFYWSGSASEYAAQQRLFYRAVKGADPDALVVLGGCDGLFDPTGFDPLPNQDATIAFLKTVLHDARDAYDVFDLHLYADPYTIADRVAFVRSEMRANGGEKPIIASEVSGPGFFEFAANRRFASQLLGPAAGADAVRRLRASIDTLPNETRMFLGASGDDASRLLRIQSEELMIRNVLGLAAGIEKLGWFDVWHDAADPDAPRNLINSPTGLFEGSALALGPPTALGEVFARVADALGNAQSVARVAVDAAPDVHVYRIVRPEQPPLLVGWWRPAHRGDSLAPVSVTLPLAEAACAARTIDGTAVDATCTAGRIELLLSDLPVIIGRDRPRPHPDRQRR